MGEQNLDMLVGAINELASKLSILTFSMYILLFMLIAAIAILKRSDRQTEFQEALDFEPGKAQRLFDQDKIDELIEYANAVVSYSPNNLYARWYLGRAYFFGRRGRTRVIF